MKSPLPRVSTPELAEQFIEGKKPGRSAKASAPAAEEASVPPPLPQSVVAAAQVSTSSPLTGIGRMPVGARVRTELAAALKHASLDRQMKGVQPNSMQDILEDAIELWLHKHGLLK